MALEIEFGKLMKPFEKKKNSFRDFMIIIIIIIRKWTCSFYGKKNITQGKFKDTIKLHCWGMSGKGGSDFH